jgi:hypothetical protein
MGWKDKQAEEAYQHTAFYASHLTLFQKYSSHPINTKVINLIVSPPQLEHKKCLEVFIAEVSTENQKGFIESAVKLKEGMKKFVWRCH